MLQISLLVAIRYNFFMQGILEPPIALLSFKFHSCFLSYIYIYIYSVHKTFFFPTIIIPVLRTTNNCSRNCFQNFGLQNSCSAGLTRIIQLTVHFCLDNHLTDLFGNWIAEQIILQNTY